MWYLSKCGIAFVLSIGILPTVKCGIFLTVKCGFENYKYGMRAFFFIVRLAQDFIASAMQRKNKMMMRERAAFQICRE